MPDGAIQRIHSDFYWLEPRGDGLIDVYLIPSGTVYPAPDGFMEYDADVRVVRGVKPSPGLEDDIRARYSAWYNTGESMERGRFFDGIRKTREGGGAGQIQAEEE
jgi:hypothetical protein